MKNQRIASKLGNIDDFGAYPRRVDYAGADLKDIDYDEKYKSEVMELETRYDSLVNDCTFRVVNDYVNGKSFCCDNDEIEIFNRPDTGNGNSEDAGFFFYHPDHLGSTAMVTDHEGRITQNVVYIPFGEVFVEQRDGNWNTPYLFNAKELDEETGLYYYGARYLDPTGAQWLSVDPLFEKYAGMSPYNYCAGNPVKLVDLDGMSTKVADNGDGTYTVVGGDLNDKDKHIYVYSKDKDGNYTIKGSSIGFTLTTTSFWDADKGDWAVGTIINPSDKSGINFLNEVTLHNVPPLWEYMLNAGNDKKYDFKRTNGTDIADHGKDVYRGMPIGGNNKGETMFASARDVGNFAAGYIAAINGMSWDASRIAFDAYQSKKSENLEIEGITTRNAEYKGWLTGYNRHQSDKEGYLQYSIIDFIKSVFK